MKNVFRKSLLMFGLLTVLVNVYAQDTWDGVTVGTSFQGGDGTATHPYEIYTASQLVYFLNEVSSGRSFSNQYVIMMADIDLNSKDPHAVGTFSGTFDGNNHWIRGFLSVAPSGWDGTFFQDVDGTIHNLAFQGTTGTGSKYRTCNAHIAMTYNLLENGHIFNCMYNINANGYVGQASTMAFYNYGKIENCKSSGVYHNSFEYSDDLCFGSICFKNMSTGIIQNCNSSVTGYNVSFKQYANQGGFNLGTIETNDDPNAWVATHSDYNYSTWSGSGNYRLSCFDPNATQSTRHSVTFIDELGLSHVEPISVENGQAVGTLPSPTSDKSFVGWKRNGSYVLPTDIVSSDWTVYACWENHVRQQPTKENPTFVVDDENNAQYLWYQINPCSIFQNWESTNKESPSQSSVTLNVTAKKDMVFACDWMVSSEEDYDLLTITINGTKVLDESGSASNHFAYTIPADGDYAICLKYSKDKSGSLGLDQASVSNITCGYPDTQLQNCTTKTLPAECLVAGCSYYCIASYADGTNSLQSDVFSVEPSDMLYIEDARTFHKSQLTVPVLMKNAKPFTAFQCDITLPEGLTLHKTMNEDDEEVFDIAYGSRAKSSHSLIANQLTNGNVRVAGYSSSNADYRDSEGMFFTLTVDVVDDASGDLTIKLSNVILTSATDGDTECPDTEAVLTIIPGQPGDVNGDGKLTMGDVVKLVNHILEVSQTGFNADLADVNEDGKVTMGDVVIVLNMILSGDYPIKAPSMRQTAVTDEVEDDTVL